MCVCLVLEVSLCCSQSSKTGRLQPPCWEEANKKQEFMFPGFETCTTHTHTHTHAHKPLCLFGSETSMTQTRSVLPFLWLAGIARTNLLFTLLLLLLFLLTFEMVAPVLYVWKKTSKSPGVALSPSFPVCFHSVRLRG